MWHVGHPRRYEECGRVGNRLAVPADFPGIAREEAQKGTEQRALPGADPPGDDRERATREVQIDTSDPSPGIGMAIRQPSHVEGVQPMSSRLGDVRS